MLTVGSLFSGIGGLELGFERAGFEIRWQVEIDPWCRRVLTKHWPNVPKYEDVKNVGAEQLEWVDVIVGGFPCQDISTAGKGAGIDGDRSGLWQEFGRIVGELRPRYAVVENVPALLSRGLGRVLGDLASVGYDAEWECISASAFGAPHRRDRIFIVAYPTRIGMEGSGAGGEQVAHTQARTRVFGCDCAGGRGEANMAHPPGEGLSVWPQGEGQPLLATQYNGLASRGREQWEVEPNVGRVVNGVPRRVDRLRGLGNAVVPQVAQYVAEYVKVHAEGI